MPTFTVISSDVKKTFPPKDGKKAAKVIALDLKDGEETKHAEWFTNADTDMPEPGSSLEGNLETSEYGLKFKKSWGGGGRQAGPPRQRDPKETAAIQWQHSQDMALVAMRLACDLNLVKPKTTDELREGLDRWAEWFYRNIERAQGIRPYGQEAPSQRRHRLETSGRSDIPSAGSEGFSHPQGPDDQFEPPAAA